MLKIKKANLEEMQNPQLVKYIGEFIVLNEVYSPVTLGIVQEQARLNALLGKAKQILKVTKESAFTEQIVKDDNNRDKLIIGFMSTVDSSRKHYDPIIKESARKVHIVSKRYKNLAREEYTKESTDLDNFIGELRANLMNEINILGLSDYLDKMEIANNQFNDSMAAREEEYYEKFPTDDVTGEKINFDDVRKLIYACYRGTIKRIEATLVLNNTPVITEYVMKLNLKIAHYDRIIAMRKGRNKAKRLGKFVSVTGVVLNLNTITINIGGNLTLIATVSPSNATMPDVAWESSEPSVATVTEKGVVNAIAAGTTTITVTTGDEEFTAECNIMVNG